MDSVVGGGGTPARAGLSLDKGALLTSHLPGPQHPQQKRGCLGVEPLRETGRWGACVWTAWPLWPRALEMGPSARHTEVGLWAHRAGLDPPQRPGPGRVQTRPPPHAPSLRLCPEMGSEQLLSAHPSPLPPRGPAFVAVLPSGLCHLPLGGRPRALPVTQAVASAPRAS